MGTSNTDSRAKGNRPADAVRDFQRKIYRKAKQEPKFRFYSLYDKICREDFLREAYKRVRANRGSPGVDGISFADVDEGGLESFLREIRKSLMEKSYRPDPVLRVMIPKSDGTERPLGIPTIRDRVVQMSCKLAIEPIFEADFDDDSFGFRPKRSAKDAVGRIKENLKAGRHEVYDADLSKYFDSIPHTKLLKTVGQRISDQKVLHLLKMWLKAPIEEGGRMSGGKKNKRGTPQGGVISPLLANIYLNLMDRMIRKRPEFRDLKMVRYADDFVLMGRKISAEALDRLTWLFKKMELSINESKTHLVDSRRSGFEFLSFTFQYHCSRLKDREGHYWNIAPSAKAQKRLRGEIKARLIKCRQRNVKIGIDQLNPLLRGWLNYFTIPGVSYTKYARGKIRIYLRDRLFRHQKRKSQRYRIAYCRKTFSRWLDAGLIDPEAYGIPDTVKT
ncbi:MAG: group II intron reverse transcriptase/maturase [Leptospiraceae bacterium]|nr:group II intron reverse transcriptase/maturase [Leptospiraceae bacterium]